jgi:hypothetical protein
MRSAPAGYDGKVSDINDRGSKHDTSEKHIEGAEPAVPTQPDASIASPDKGEAIIDSSGAIISTQARHPERA